MDKTTIQVDFYGAVQKAFGERSINLNLNPGASVEQALEALATTPARRSILFDPSGGIHKDLTLLINGRNIAFLGGAAAGLSQGDVLAVFPPTYGG